MNFDIIEKKYEKLIDFAKRKMMESHDFEHDLGHIEDVVFYIKKLLTVLKINADVEVCILSTYWHDIGRLQSQKNHEKISAQMLQKELQKQKFENSFIDKVSFIATLDK